MEDKVSRINERIKRRIKNVDLKRKGPHKYIHKSLID